MRNRVLGIGLVIALLVVFSGIAVAQEDEPLKLAEGIGLSTEDGLLALSYPADWIAQTSAESVLLSSADGVSGVVTFTLREALDDDEISPADYLAESFGFDDEEDERYAGFGDIDSATLNGREAAISNGVQVTGASTRDVTLITVDAGDALVTFVFTAPEGAGEAAAPLYGAIAGGVDFAPPFEASAMVR